MGAHIFQLLTDYRGGDGQAQDDTVCHFVPETRTSAVDVTLDDHGYEYRYGSVRMLHEIGHTLGLDDILEKNGTDTCRVND